LVSWEILVEGGGGGGVGGACLRSRAGIVEFGFFGLFSFRFAMSKPVNTRDSITQ